MRKAATIRNAEIATIKIAIKQLGMDDGTYRDMLWTVARVRSAADLDWTGRKKVIDHLVGCGAKVGKKSGKRNEWSFIDRAKEDCRPLLRKIYMLAKSAGKGKAYVEGIAANMDAQIREAEQTKPVRPLEFCTKDELWRIANSLIAHLERQKP